MFIRKTTKVGKGRLSCRKKKNEEINIQFMVYCREEIKIWWRV